MMKRSVSKSLLVGLSATVLLLGASGVYANGETCTFNNWSGAVGDANLKAGTPEDGNRRYTGPCGLRVSLAGSEAYLTDTSPLAETVFNVRFYFFLTSVVEDVSIFEALDGADRAMSATYNHSENKVNVAFQTGNGSTSSTLSVGPVATGWNSLEIQWSSGATATPKAILGNASATDTQTLAPVDTSNFTIDSAKLGAINALAIVPSGGSIDFDDYDSRRDTVPGRLLTGDANGDGSLNIFDVVATRNNILGNSVAQGQPDCNEDGLINIFDVVCMRVRILGP